MKYLYTATLLLALSTPTQAVGKMDPCDSDCAGVLREYNSCMQEAKNKSERKRCGSSAVSQCKKPCREHSANDENEAED